MVKFCFILFSKIIEMKKLIFYCFIVVFMGCQGTSTKKNATTIVDLNGKEVQLSDFKGKRILVNYWATWCGPCIKEMPALARAEQILKENNYVFLLITDESIEEILTFKSSINNDFNFLKLNGSIESLGVYALPTTFVYNEKGEKIKEIVGAVIWDSNEMITSLKEIK